MKIDIIDLIVIIVYFVLMGIVGYICSLKNKSTEEYFVGGRSFAGWIVGLSLVGTSISSISFLALPADAFKTSWIRYLPNFMLPVTVLIASHTFLPFFRSRKTTSAYQFLEERFGVSVRVYGTLAFMVAQVVRVSIVLYLTSIVIHEITGLSTQWCIIISGSFVAIYTIIGGIDAVIWTDVIQTITLVLGGVLCLIVVISKIPGGLFEVIDMGIEHHKLSFATLANGELKPISFFGPLHNKTIFMILMTGLATWTTQYCSNQTIIQRYCATKNLKNARGAMWTCVWSSLPIWAFFMFLGTSLYVYFQKFPDPHATAILTGEAKAEEVLPFFVINFLPAGLGGLIIAATLAAAMSSLDSSINAISTISVVDIYKRLCNKEQNDRHYLKAAWIFATLAAIVMISGALILNEAETNTLQDTGIALSSVVAGGMLSIYLLGFFTNVRGVASIWAGIISTLTFTIWTVFSARGILPESISFNFDLYYTIIFGNIVMFFVGLIFYKVFSKFIKRKDLTQEQINKIYE